jgi:hypothetical protein
MYCHTGLGASERRVSTGERLAIRLSTRRHAAAGRRPPAGPQPSTFACDFPVFRPVGGKNRRRCAALVGGDGRQRERLIAGDSVNSPVHPDYSPRRRADRRSSLPMTSAAPRLVRRCCPDECSSSTRPPWRCAGLHRTAQLQRPLPCSALDARSTAPLAEAGCPTRSHAPADRHPRRAALAHRALPARLPQPRHRCASAPYGFLSLNFVPSL